VKKSLGLLLSLLFLFCSGCSSATIIPSSAGISFPSVTNSSTVQATPSTTCPSENTTVTKPTESFVAELEIAKTADQILVVSASGTTAEITMHVKNADGFWYELFFTYGYVGYNGVGTASEGSQTTPKGVYSLTTAFGILQDPGTALPYTQVDASHYWVDDPSSRYYNKFVSTNDVEKDWTSAEHLADYTHAYAYAIAIDYNITCIPGAGSAFFLHCSTNSPTYGCVAVSKEDMLFILQNISRNAYIVIQSE